MNIAKQTCCFGLMLATLCQGCVSQDAGAPEAGAAKATARQSAVAAADWSSPDDAPARQPAVTTHELRAVAAMFDRVDEREYLLFLRAGGYHRIEISPNGAVTMGDLQQFLTPNEAIFGGSCATAFMLDGKRHYAFVLGSFPEGSELRAYDVVVFNEDFETVWRHRMPRQRAISLWWPRMCETLVSPDGETTLVVIHESGWAFYDASNGEVLHVHEKKPSVPSPDARVLKIRSGDEEVLLLPSRNEMYAVGARGKILAKKRAPKDSNTINVTYLTLDRGESRAYCSWSLHSTQTQSEIFHVQYRGGEIEFTPTGMSWHELNNNELQQEVIPEVDRVMYSPESGRTYSAKGMGQARRVRIYCTGRDTDRVAYRFFPETP